MFSASGAVLQLAEDRYAVFSDLEFSSQPAQLFAPDFFGAQNGGWYSAGSVEVVGAGRLRGAFSAPKWNWVEPDKEDFASTFQMARSGFASGDLQKVVPTVFAEASCGEIPKGFLLDRLSRTPKNLHAYAFWKDDDAIFGMTPEVLFSGVDQQFETMALAGTRPIADLSRKPLLEDQKEMKEHRIVIDAIVRKLSELGKVEVGDTDLLKLPSLEHLHTAICLSSSREIAFSELVAALHPTPALGGEPAAAAWDLLQKWDRGRRRFGAPFGAVLPNGESRCLVAIRNIQFSGGRAYLGSGCGLVSESELDREWDELYLKRQSVLKLLELA